MAFSRILLGWAAVALWLTVWHEVERRLRRIAVPALPALRASLPALLTEALLLALFAGLWFGSLGSGGAVLLFLVLGALMEIPSRLRSRPGEGLAWKAVVAGVVRTVIAGVLLGALLG
jgi:Na+/H+ antiporter NhaC